jgi:hypothetical protein
MLDTHTRTDLSRSLHELVRSQTPAGSRIALDLLPGDQVKMLDAAGHRVPARVERFTMETGAPTDDTGPAVTILFSDPLDPEAPSWAEVFGWDERFTMVPPFVPETPLF